MTMVMYINRCAWSNLTVLAEGQCQGGPKSLQSCPLRLQSQRKKPVKMKPAFPSLSEGAKRLLHLKSSSEETRSPASPSLSVEVTQLPLPLGLWTDRDLKRCSGQGMDSGCEVAG